jgi:hypothetical protein
MAITLHRALGLVALVMRHAGNWAKDPARSAMLDLQTEKVRIGSRMT